MGKIITYIIFGAIGAFFLLGPGIGLYFVSKGPIEALSYQGREVGVVEACRSKRIYAGNDVRYIRSPIVRLPDGRTVRGTVDEVRFFYPCDNLIGQKLSVRYDLNNPKKARINTFHQMWFGSLPIALVCLLLYGVLGAGFLWKKR